MTRRCCRPAARPPTTTGRAAPFPPPRRRQCLGAEPQLVPSGPPTRNGSELDTRLQTEPPPGSCWAQSILPPPFLEGVPRFLLCPPRLSSRIGSARWSFPPGSVRAARSLNNFRSFSFVASRSGCDSPGPLRLLKL